MKKSVKIIDLILLFVYNFFLTNQLITSIIFSLGLFIGIYAFRVYDDDNMNSANDSIIRALIGNIIGVFIVFVFYFFFRFPLKSSDFVYNAVFTVLIFPFLHKIEYKIYIKNMIHKKYLVIGRKNEIGYILDEISEKTHGRKIFVDYINPSPEALEEMVKNGFNMEDIKNLNSTLSFFYRETTSKYDAILVTDPKLEEMVKEEIESYKEMGIPVEYLPNLVEKILKRIPIDVAERFKDYYRVAFDSITETPSKRMLDIIVSSVALVILSPFLLLTAIAIIIEDGIPAVFKQKRVGLNGEVFEMHKFRSMKNIKENESKFAIDEQHRVLKIGKIIRPIRMDETLQFYDILRGAMSFVGPRPEQVKFVEDYNQMIPFYGSRHKLKTGLTGWAQIMYQYAANLEQSKKKLSYDLYYVKNRSTILDLQIILKTIEAVVWKRGAM